MAASTRAEQKPNTEAQSVITTTISDTKGDEKRENSIPSKSILDFDKLINECVTQWAKKLDARIKWIAYSEQSLDKRLPDKQKSTGKKRHKLFKGAYQLSLEAKEVPKVVSETSTLDSVKPPKVVRRFQVDNSLPTPFEKKDIIVKDTLNSTWKETTTTTKSLEATVVMGVSVPGLSTFQATLKGTLTRAHADESSAGMANEMSIPLSITLPAASRNNLEIVCRESHVIRTVEAKATISGSIVICFNKKVKMPDINQDSRRKWAIPLGHIAKKIEEYKIDHTGFDFTPSDEIHFIQRETSEAIKSVGTAINVVQSDKLPTELVSQAHEAVKKTDETITRELANVFRVFTVADDGEISLDTDNADETIIKTTEAVGKVANTLLQGGFFGGGRANQVDAVRAEGRGKITFGKRSTAAVKKIKDETKADVIVSQEVAAKK